jgi:hypothetical protein
MSENEIAIMEAEMSAAADEYFGHRPQLIRGSDLERIFEAGFKKAWKEKSRLEAINAELVEALTKIGKTCDPHMSHQEEFILKTIDNVLTKNNLINGQSKPQSNAI